nr:hypothetical protein Clen_401 [Cedratvirus lena]
MTLQKCFTQEPLFSPLSNITHEAKDCFDLDHTDRTFSVRVALVWLVTLVENVL